MSEIGVIKKQNKSASGVGLNIFTINQAITWIIVALGFLLPWLFTTTTSEFYETAKNSFLIICVAVISILWVVKFLIRKKITFVRTVFDLPIVFYMFSKTVSTIFSIYKPASIWGYHSSLSGGFISEISLIILYYAIVNNVTSKVGIRKILKSIVLSGFLLAGFTVCKSFSVFGSSFSYLVENNANLSFLNEKSFTPIGNSNALAAYFATLLPICIYFLSTKVEKKIGKKMLLIVGIVLVLLAMGITSFSENTFVSLIYWSVVVGVCVFVFILKYKENKSVLSFFVPIILALLFSVFLGTSSEFRNKIDSNIEFQKTNISSFDTDWSVITGMFSEYKVKGFLVGSGLDTYAYNYPRFRPEEQNYGITWYENYTTPISKVFSLISNSGLIGLAAFLLFFAFLVLFFRKVFCLEENKTTLLFMCLSLIVFCLLNFLFHATISVVSIFWIISAVLISLYQASVKGLREEKEVYLSVSKGGSSIDEEVGVFSYLASFVLISLLVGGIFIVGRSFHSEVNYKSSLKALESGKLGKANDNIILAIKKFGNRDYYHRQFASVGFLTFKEFVETENDEENDAYENYQSYLINLIERELEKAIELNDLNVKNWESTAAIYKQLTEYTGGKMYGTHTLTAASKAVELNPYNPDNYLILGFVYQHNSDEKLQKQAEGVYVQALRLRPDYLLTILTFGNYLESNERFDEAVLLYQTSINNYYSEESEVRGVLEKRIELVEEKKNDSAGEENNATETEETLELENIN